MKIRELLQSGAVTVKLEAKEKNDVLSDLVDLLIDSGGVKKADKESIIKKLKERETLGSTGIGKGVGIPHAKFASLKKMVGAMGISKEGVDFKSLDGEPTYIFFLLIAPGETPGPHLKALAKISRLLDDKFVRDRLRSAKTNQDVIKILEEEEEKKAL
ncbi:MAG TPA: PTS sugar transporter subunit IIA [Candidatus Omnitrophota bacterium]|nr:PTS sugar transporter subunit IIA [Candidatus Omnitrophota bacterium]HPS20799.1 PTS sugar transporter subunit IIA [Candidatus Omnitrophota bacterium]